MHTFSLSGCWFGLGVLFVKGGWHCFDSLFATFGCKVLCKELRDAVFGFCSIGLPGEDVLVCVDLPKLLGLFGGLKKYCGVVARHKFVDFAVNEVYGAGSNFSYPLAW